MKLKYIIISLLIITLFLVGCFQPIRDNYVCLDGSIVTDASLCPQEETPTQQAPVQQPIQPQPQQNTEITQLIQKGKQQTNYKYSFTGTEISNRGQLEPLPSYDVFIKDRNMKIVYTDNIKYAEDMYYNEVYYNSKDTIGFCSTDGECGYNGKAYVLPYNDNVPSFTPVSLLADVPSDAEKFGESTQDGRDMTIIQYDNKRMTIDSFYGVPVELITFNGETVTHKYNFNRLTVNTVKDSDVILDSRFERVE